MKTIIISALLASLTITAVASAESAASKKPIVCTEWTVLTAPGKRVALCTDRKSPVMLTRWMSVTIPLDAKTDPVGGEERKVIVGWK